MTYELNTIDPSMLLHKLVDISAVHPFGYHRKPVIFQIQFHTKQRQDVWVLEVSPQNGLPAEYL